MSVVAKKPPIEVGDEVVWIGPRGKRLRGTVACVRQKQVYSKGGVSLAASAIEAEARPWLADIVFDGDWTQFRTVGCDALTWSGQGAVGQAREQLKCVKEAIQNARDAEKGENYLALAAGGMDTLHKNDIVLVKVPRRHGWERGHFIEFTKQYELRVRTDFDGKNHRVRPQEAQRARV